MSFNIDFNQIAVFVNQISVFFYTVVRTIIVNFL